VQAVEARGFSLWVFGGVGWGLSLAVVAGLGACATPAPVSESEMARAAAALAPLKKELRSALMGALREGGPERAIEVCRLRAPEIARLTSTGDAVLGRTSHRLRNPENAPKAWMSGLLEEYLANPDDREPRAVRLAPGVIGYAEPIRMKGLCMRCHGDRIEPEVRARLETLYPEDEATGFKRGELRGMFWVELQTDAR
jgi:hypothetical protein